MMASQPSTPRPDILLDSCIGRPIADALRSAGYDVARVAEWGTDPGDAETLATAASQRRVLITEDRDFGELIVARGQVHCGVIRLVQLPFASQPAACLRLLETMGAELAAGALVTVEPGRVRVRTPEPG